nr:tryptophan--tRNA ligase [Saprospiraceae bacterium]
ADEQKILKQIRSAVTDSGDVPADQMSPGMENLFNIYREIDRRAHDSFLLDYRAGKLSYGDFKTELGNSLVEFTRPFKERLKEISADKKAVRNQVKESSSEIRKVAATTLKEVKELAGLI